jgi:hypothetical protein
MGAGVPDGLQTRMSFERGTVGSIPTRLRQFYAVRRKTAKCVTRMAYSVVRNA